ncbi:MAG TPA: septum formation initiator family protein [Bryobacteraceae bacterium]
MRLAGGAGAALLLSVCGWIAFRGPQGFPVLFEKRREIRLWEERNAALDRDNQLRRDRLRRLEESPSEQELEIRKQLKLLRPGETTFILPDTPKHENDK